MSAPPPSSPERLSAGDYLLLALWAGAITGWLEASLTYALRYAPAISPYRKAGLEVFWVSPLANIAVMAVVVLFVRLVAKRFAGAGSPAVVIGAIGATGVVAVVGYPRVIHEAALGLLAIGIGAVLARRLSNDLTTVVAFCRRNVAWVLMAVAASAAGASAVAWGREWAAVRALPEAAADAPNIMVVVIDTLRGDRLSSAGYARRTSPNLDTLARQGVQYFNAWSTASWTAPSHATLLTGRYTFEHGVDYPVPDIHHRYRRLPQVLAAAGYRTGLFSANLGPCTEEYLTAGFRHEDTYTALSTLFRGSILRSPRYLLTSLARIELPPPKRADTVTDDFLRWAARDGHRPFFALLNYIDVHEHVRPEWRLPPEFETRFGDVSRRRRKDSSVTFDDVSVFYDSAVAYVDDRLGRLFQALDRERLTDNTILVVTSDHGEAIGEHGDDGHGSSLYREQLHVPLIVRFPRRVPAGGRVSDAVSLASIPATLLAMAGVEASVPGTPLPIRDAAAQGRAATAPLLAELSLLETGPTAKSLITQRFQYIRSVVTGREELFDYRADPLETVNLVEQPSAAPIAQELRQRLLALFPQLAATTTPSRVPRHVGQ